MEFGTRLYELRKQQSLSQEELAARLEVTRQTVSKWEVGDSTPDMKNLIVLSEIFGVTLDELMTGKVPVTTKLDQLGAKVLTQENRRRADKGLKLLLLAAGVLLAVDAVSMVVYFLLWGLPG